MQRRLICLAATLATGLPLSAAHAQAATDVAKVPDGMISIHYHRKAGDYDGWGTHLWESYEKVENGKLGGKTKSDKPLDGITWMAPMKPTGKDGFGVYWQVKADEFRNGKINYIVHKGDSKDCPKDSTWMIDQGRQIFLNSGDCTAYFTADEALKARK